MAPAEPSALERQSRGWSWPAAPRIWIGFSGGLDSTVLLDLAWRLRIPGVQAVHVHHGLQAAADAWVEAVGAFCAERAIPLTVRRVQVEAQSGAGLEAAARQAREAAFAALLAPGDSLWLAHHQDDQAETLLLNLLRGAGREGLAAMPVQRLLGAGRLWRPLLHTPRALIEAHARHHGLRWIEDPHNQDPRFQRVWLRQQVLPLLRTRYPALTRTLARTATLLASEPPAAAASLRFDTGALAGLPRAGQRERLRGWLRAAGLRPSLAMLERVLDEVIGARPDAQPRLRLAGWTIQRYRQTLSLVPVTASDAAAIEPQQWNGQGRLPLATGDWLDGEAAAGSGPWQVRALRGQDRFQPAGQPHRRTLKNLFQEAGLAPAQRRRTPGLWRGETLVWVGGLGWSQPALAAGHNFALRWHTSAHLEKTDSCEQEN
ncbi:MAG TPA: tRNA lysidine(34) synthetase TilS [Nevskiaceae bacterium]|nr:tRNA lysidine(34) synthetase TilS [Nevskiaceae bacterium]